MYILYPSYIFMYYIMYICSYVHILFIILINFFILWNFSDKV